MDSMIRNAWVCLELECVKAMWNLSTWSKLGLKHSSFFSFTKERQSVSRQFLNKIYLTFFICHHNAMNALLNTMK